MLSKFSVQKPYTIFVAVIIVIILGFISFTSMPTDLLPKMDLPYAIVMTTYIGASPEKVETSVTKPIEQTVSTVTNVKNVNSVSSESSSVVIIEFSETVNMDSALIELNSSLDLIKSSLPDEVSSPTVLKINPDMLPVAISAIDIDNMSLQDISSIVSKDIVPSLERTNGVASVSATGLVEEKIKIVLNQSKIDEINSKVLDNLDSKLSESQAELDKAKNELNKGKLAIQTQSKEQTAKIVDGQFALRKATEQLNDAESSLDCKESELMFLKNGLEQALNVLTIKEPELQAQIVELSRNENLSLVQKATIEQLQNTYNTLQDTKNTTNLKLNELNDGLLQISNGKNELLNQKNKIEEQEKQLEIAKVTLATELSKAANQIANSELELEKGQKEFDSAREEAYKKANLDGIITQNMISNILMAENFSMPAGFIESDNDKLTVKVGEKFSNIDEIKNLTIFSFDIEGLENVTLEQLADISFNDNKDELYAKVNGNDAIIVSFQKQSTASTTEVSNDIKKSIKKIEDDNPNIHFTMLMDQGVYINLVISSVLENLLYGGSLAIIILLIFLRDIRPTIIISLSIPISLTFAIALMYFSGVTINIVSLSGLALGVGMLVDNSIVVIENIYRLRGEGKSLKEAAIKGASSVAGAIFASTLTTVCVFLPIVFIQGITRQLFADMGLTIAYSLIASLIVALTLVPAMASSVFKNTNKKEHTLFNIFSKLYETILKLSLKAKPLVVVLSIVILVLSGIWASKMGTAFIPEAEGMQMSISIELPIESTFDDLKQTSNMVIERLLTINDIKSIGAITGSSNMMSSLSSNSSKTVNMYAILKDDKKLSNSQIKNNIINLTSDLNCEISVSTSNMDLSAMSGSGIQVMIKGEDIPTMQNIAKDISQLMEETEGLTEIDNGNGNINKELKIIVDKNKAMSYGITVATVFQNVSSAILNETKSTEITIDSKDYPVIVVKPESKQITESNLDSLELDGKENQEEIKVKLSDIATIDKTNTSSSINHENNQRYVSVSSEVDSEHNIGLVSRAFEEKLKKYEVPNGYTVEIEGESETINNTLVDLVKMIALAILFIYLIMVAQFQSLLAPFIIMFTIPLAFTGGLLALGITGTEISIIAMLGFLVLSGIVVNNGIVLIDYINQLRKSGKNKKDAIIEAGKTRLRPIFMTALTTILGLFTLSLGVGSGSQMLQPMGIVTIGGLLYSTLLTLIVVPCLYDMMHKEKNS